MSERKILLPYMDPEVVRKEIGDFVIGKMAENMDKTGCVIGLSGGVDSTVTAALIKHAFDRYNEKFDKGYELVGYILPSSVNDPADARDGVAVAERLGLRHEVHSIEHQIEAYLKTNPEAFEKEYHAGNLRSRIRANILHTKASTENKSVAGTGNKDEDIGIGYYTLGGDGFVHFSPIANLSKRLVREMARYVGFDDLADRIPTAGLEPGQTDFGDLGYDYDVIELVTEGFAQGFNIGELARHSEVAPLILEQRTRWLEMMDEEEIEYDTSTETGRYDLALVTVTDIYNRHESAKHKMELLHPDAAPVTLKYV